MIKLTEHNTLLDGSDWSLHNKTLGDYDMANAWIDPGPSPAGNPGPYLKAETICGDGVVSRIYPNTDGTLVKINSEWFVVGVSENDLPAVQNG